MTEIEKLKEGRRVSRAEYNKAKAEYENVYANADEATRAKLDGLMRSSQNYSSADPMNNRSTREFATQMYRNAIQIANGEYTAAPSATASTKNMFGGYSHDENRNNANTLTSRYLSGGSRQSTPAYGSPVSGGTSSAGTSSAGRTFYNFNWGEGIGSSFGLDTESFQDKYDRFLDGLIKNVDNAISAKSEGKSIRGLSTDTVSQLGIISDGLKSLKSKSRTLDQNTALKEILKFAGPLKIDEQGFKTYFDGYLPQKSERDKAKDRLIGEGYKFNVQSTGNAALDNLIKNNNWSIGTLGDKNYLFDSNFNIVNQPSTYIDDNYLDETNYGTGYAIGQDGTYYTGPMQVDQNNPWFQQIDDYVKNTLVKKNDQRFVSSTSEWNYKSSISQKDLVNHFGRALQGKKIIDVGRYFEGNKGVIATVDDNNLEAHVDRYGNLKLDDPAITFYYEKPDGTYGTSKSYKDVGTINLHNDSETAGGFESFVNFAPQLTNIQTTLTDLDDDANRESEPRNFFTGNGENLFHKGPKNPLTDNEESIDLQNDISDQIPEVARMLLFLGTATDAEIEAAGSTGVGHATRELKKMKTNWFGNGRALEAIKFINDAIKSDESVIGNDKLLNAWRQLLLQYKDDLSTLSSVSSNKQGGILKAAWGTTLDVSGNPISPQIQSNSTYNKLREKANTTKKEFDALEQRARERGVSTDVQQASERGWTTSDSLRAAALVQDIAGTIAAVSGAFTSGAGSIAGEVLGFTSMGTDLVADIADDSMTAKDVIKNAAINTGFALTSFIPGAKTSKIIKSAVKILPSAMAALAAANVTLDPEIHKSIQKVMNNGKAGNGTVTTKDWQNVMFALRAVSGIGRSTAAIKNRRVSAKKLERAQSSVNPDEVSVRLSKDKVARLKKADADKIDAALKTGASDQVKQEASAILSQHGETLDSIKTNRNPQTWKERITRGGEKSLERVTTETNVDPIKLSKVLEEEDAAYQAKLQNSAWQRGLASMDQRLSRFAPGVNRGTSYSPFQMQMIRQYGIKPGMSGSTAEIQDKLVADAPYSIVEESLRTKSNYEQARENSRANEKAAMTADLGTDVDSKGRKYSDSAAARRQARKNANEATTKHGEAEKLYNDNESALQAEINAQRGREATLNGIKNDTVKQAQITAAETEYAAKQAAYNAEIAKSGPDSVTSKQLESEVASANLKVQQAKQELLAAEKAVKDGNTSIADLQAKQQQYKTALDNAKNTMDQANQTLADEETSFKALRDNIKAKSLGRKDAAISKAVIDANASRSGRTKTFKDIEVLDSKGAKTKIAKGTDVISLIGLSDAEAKRVIPTGAKKISKTEAAKLVPEGTEINGAAIEGNKLYIFYNGGKINNKYSHLRK